MHNYDNEAAQVTERPFECWFEEEKVRIADALAGYISIDTTSPNEWRAKPFLKNLLEPLGFTLTELTLPDSFWSHPERAPEPVSKITVQSSLLRAHRPGKPGGRHIIVNAHVDVVPLQPQFKDGMTAQVFEDRIVGRGAVDTKGNLIMFVEALRWLVASGDDTDHALTLDLVSEEEIGGNGALASTLSGCPADCCLVLEPTGGEIFRGHRGCVTFEAEFTGHARHMGDAKGTEFTAIDAATEAIRQLKKLEKRLDGEKAFAPAFTDWERALQINVGEVKGGDWYGSTPRSCKISGNCGFLPHQGLSGTQERLQSFFSTLVEDMPGIEVSLTWPALRNESCLIPMDNPFITALAVLTGHKAPFRAWNVSCDGRHYARLMGVPTVIYGCGSLKEAHAVNETLYFHELKDGIALTAKILTDTLGGN